MCIVIIDYGLSNLNSVLNTIKNINNNVIITKDKNKLLRAKILILPGIGTFSDGMKNIIERDLFDTIRLCVIEKKIPIIGICLGMQLLATHGYEGGKTKGLNLIEGEITKIISSDIKYKIPHVGWNEIIHKNEPLFNGIPNNSNFYFLHSYEFNVKYKSDILTTTKYISEFTSSIQRDNIYGFQFHPEKSQNAGNILLKNVIKKYI